MGYFIKPVEIINFILGILLPETQAFAAGSFKKKICQPDQLFFKVPIQAVGDISAAEFLPFPESTTVAQTFRKENFEIILKSPDVFI